MIGEKIQIQNLHVGVGDKEILQGVNLTFELGKNYCLLGKNGSGKSTLSSVLMGSPEYEVRGGSIEVYNPSQPSFPTKGRGDTVIDIVSLSPEERSQYGIFLSFQHVPEILGIKLSEYLRTIYNIHLKQTQPEVRELSPFIFKRFIVPYLEELHIDPVFLDRDLNVGFSGGEKRKIEILQMKLIGPKYIILDEIDSGLDIDAFKRVAELLKSINSESNSIIIITHYFTILEYVEVDEVYVLEKGKVVEHGGKEVIEKVKEGGYR
ncbi:MAG: Fe-S cluster assembly ATPase SufC [Candidatus Peribacteria bacterium]|nr:MAG: Fe-S cluster assembly ATPase SufC [Candidatus Peribacteria bacterium]